MPSHSSPRSNDGADAYPLFDLNCKFDDPENPSQVTVFVDHPEALRTHWITIDADHAEDLADFR